MKLIKQTLLYILPKNSLSSSNEIAVVDWEQGYVVNQQILIARFFLFCFFVLNNELATSHNYDQ